MKRAISRTNGELFGNWERIPYFCNEAEGTDLCIMMDYSTCAPWEQPSTLGTFAQRESVCEKVFKESGPFWHLCTPGQATELLFETKEDYCFMMNQQAILAPAYDVTIIAFEVMSNHLHDILMGMREACQEYFKALKRKFRRYCTSKNRYVRLDEFEPQIIPIDSLKMIRTEIVYTHRNGFLVNPDCTPFSYPWGSGSLYFNQLPDLSLFTRYDDLPDLVKRDICKGRAATVPEGYRVDSSGLILPQSYCDYRRGMALFRDAQNYFSLISKNFEAYSEVAKRLGDTMFLCDDELFSLLCIKSKKQFNESRPSMLSNQQKLEMARMMRRDYNASEGQIRRMLRLDPALISELFGRQLAFRA